MKELKLTDTVLDKEKRENKALLAERLAAEALYREEYKRKLTENNAKDEIFEQEPPRVELEPEEFVPIRKDNFTYTIPDTLPETEACDREAREAVSEPTEPRINAPTPEMEARGECAEPSPCESAEGSEPPRAEPHALESTDAPEAPRAEPEAAETAESEPTSRESCDGVIAFPAVSFTVSVDIPEEESEDNVPREPSVSTPLPILLSETKEERGKAFECGIGEDILPAGLVAGAVAPSYPSAAECELSGDGVPLDYSYSDLPRDPELRDIGAEGVTEPHAPYSLDREYSAINLGDNAFDGVDISDHEYSEGASYSPTVESSHFVDSQLYSDDYPHTSGVAPTEQELMLEYKRALLEDAEVRRRTAASETDIPEGERYNLTGDYNFDVTTATAEAERLVRRRMTFISTSLEYKADMLAVTFGANADRNARRADRMQSRARRARRKSAKAVRLERRDFIRYYSAYFDKYEGDPERRVRSVAKLETIKRRLDYVLTRIGEIDKELLGLYAEEGATDKRARLPRSKRAAMRTARRVHASLKKLGRRIKKLHAPLDIKEKLYNLLNDKQNAHSTLAYVKHELRSSARDKETRRELKRKRREAKRTVRSIDGEIDRYMRKAERHNDTHSANKLQVFWILLLILIIGGAAIIYFRFPELLENIIARLKGGM